MANYTYRCPVGGSVEIKELARVDAFGEPGGGALLNGGLGGKWEIVPLLLGYSAFRQDQLVWDGAQYRLPGNTRVTLVMNPYPTDQYPHPIYGPTGSVKYTAPPMVTLFDRVVLYESMNSFRRVPITVEVILAPGAAYVPPVPVHTPSPTLEQIFESRGLAFPANDAEKLAFLMRGVNNLCHQLMQTVGWINTDGIGDPAHAVTPLRYFLGGPLTQLFADIARFGLQDQIPEPFRSWSLSLEQERQTGVPVERIGIDRIPAPPDLNAPAYAGHGGGDFAVWDAPAFMSPEEFDPYIRYLGKETGASVQPNYLFGDPTMDLRVVIAKYALYRGDKPWDTLVREAIQNAIQERDFLRARGMKTLGNYYPNVTSYLQSSPSLTPYYQKFLSGAVVSKEELDAAELYRWKLGDVYIALRLVGYTLWDISDPANPQFVAKLWRVRVDQDVIPQEGPSLLEQIGVGVLLAGVGFLSGGAAAACVAAVGPALVTSAALIGGLAGSVAGLTFGEIEYQKNHDLGSALEKAAIAGGISGAIAGAVLNAAATVGTATTGETAAVSSTTSKLLATATSGAVKAVGGAASAVLTGKIVSEINKLVGGDPLEETGGTEASVLIEETAPPKKDSGLVFVGALVAASLFLLNNK